MSFLDETMDGGGKKVSNKRKAPAKKAKKLRDHAPTELLDMAAKRFAASIKIMQDAAKLVVDEKNKVVEEMIRVDTENRRAYEAALAAWEAAGGGDAKAEKPEPPVQEVSLQAFIQKRLAMKDNETPAAYARRIKNVREALDGFIENKLMALDDDNGRIQKWLRKQGLDACEFVEETGASFTTTGKRDFDGKGNADQWQGALRYSFGAQILSTIRATLPMKKKVAQICTVANQDDEDADRMERYYDALYKMIAQSLLFGPLPVKKAKSNKKAADAVLEDEVSFSDDEEQEGSGDGDDDDEDSEDDDDDDSDADGDDDDDDDEDDDDEDDDDDVDDKVKRRKKTASKKPTARETTNGHAKKKPKKEVAAEAPSKAAAKPASPKHEVSATPIKIERVEPVAETPISVQVKIEAAVKTEPMPEKEAPPPPPEVVAVTVKQEPETTKDAMQEDVGAVKEVVVEKAT